MKGKKVRLVGHFGGFLVYAVDGIISFSTTPLIFSTITGIVFSVIAFITMIFIIVKTLLFGDAISGWPSLMCAILFVGGIQLIGIGILGQYLSKTYIETKKRPYFITKETNIE